MPKLYIIDYCTGTAITGYVAGVHFGGTDLGTAPDPTVPVSGLDECITLHPAVTLHSQERLTKRLTHGTHTLIFPFIYVPEEDDQGGIWHNAHITSSPAAHAAKMRRRADAALLDRYMAEGEGLPVPPVQPYQLTFPGFTPVRKRFIVPNREHCHFTPTIEHLLKVRELHRDLFFP